MNLEMYTGSQVFTQLQTDAFQSAWQTLYDRCPWASACQHPDFVMPWYALYEEAFLPVLVLGKTASGELAGIIALALDRQKNKLVGAGERQAEYQGWLEQPATNNAFIGKALERLRTDFPGADVHLRYLPPGIPVDWIDADARLRKFCSVRSHARPIMKIDEAAMLRQRNKKNHRQNFNRLKRLGDVQFQRVTDHEQFIRWFDEICMQYDFRQGALHRIMPFSTDPAKKPFYLELHRRGLLHATVLTVDGRIAASHCGLLTKARAVHVGINTHAPTFAAHSPGMLLLAMLGVHLAEEQVPILDLTPGGDGYKEQFASGHDQVFELIAYADIRTRLKMETLLTAKMFVKDRLRKAGVSTADITAALGKLTRLRELGLRAWPHSLAAGGKAPQRMYRHDSQAVLPGANGGLQISSDSLKDVFRFDAQGSRLTRWEFLRTAMERMERSNRLYSFVRDGKLLICCWARARMAAPIQPHADQPAAAGDTAVMLSDLYVHRQLKEQELVQRFVEQLLLELKKSQASRAVYFDAVPERELQDIIKRCGFTETSD